MISVNIKKIVTLIFALLISVTLHAAEPTLFIKTVKLPSGQTAVIAEGDLEARSIGSFSVRLYEAAPPGDETTFFTAGLILGRDGTIEKVVLEDINDDQQPEIIVIVRSVGTGSYLSSHAFVFDKEQLSYLAFVDNLPSTADPVKTLRTSVRKE